MTPTMSNTSDYVSPNARRWLNLISFAEGTYGKTGPRYDITFGYTPIKDLSKHPDRIVQSGGYSSAAAGAYQFMPSTWQRAASAVGAKDFGPRSQDLAALQLMRWRGVDPDKSPVSPENIAKLSGEWAALPTAKGVSAYGQPSKPFGKLLSFAQSQGANVVPQGATGSQGGAGTEEVLAQTLLGSYLGNLLSKRTDTDMGYKVPEVPHSTDQEETEPELTPEILKAVVDAIGTDSSDTESKNYLLSQGISNLSSTQDRMSKLLQSAQSAFKPGVAV